MITSDKNIALVLRRAAGVARTFEEVPGSGIWTGALDVPMLIWPMRRVSLSMYESGELDLYRTVKLFCASPARDALCREQTL